MRWKTFPTPYASVACLLINFVRVSLCSAFCSSSEKYFFVFSFRGKFFQRFWNESNVTVCGMRVYGERAVQWNSRLENVSNSSELWMVQSFSTDCTIKSVRRWRVKGPNENYRPHTFYILSEKCPASPHSLSFLTNTHTHTDTYIQLMKHRRRRHFHVVSLPHLWTHCERDKSTREIPK